MGSGTGGSGKGGGLMENVIQQIAAQNPQQQPNNFTYTQPQPNPYSTDYARYNSQPTRSNISGEAFGSGVNSDSGIASILAGLYSSGVLNQQTTNPYAPQGTTGSFNAIPYGQQQESMFSHQGLGGRPYGGYQGQNWNPYDNYYTSSNTSAGGGNTNNNIAPPPGTTGPDAIQQLSFPVSDM